MVALIATPDELRARRADARAELGDIRRRLASARKTRQEATPWGDAWLKANAEMGRLNLELNRAQSRVIGLDSFLAEVES